MQPTEPPRIEFPCRYPIKVMGEARDDFADFVVATEIGRASCRERV